MSTTASRKNVEGSWGIIETTDPAVAAYLAALPPLDQAVPRGEESASVYADSTDGGTTWLASKAAFEAAEALA